jgi:holo-[acyl-carrier protein] synthase
LEGAAVTDSSAPARPPALSVGIDLVSADTVRDSIAEHGSHYLERVYSHQEVDDCRTAAGVDPERLAARFAAKEAVFKALRVADDPVAWRDVEVRREPGGWVTISLSGNAASIAQRAGITELSVSLTHERGCAAAVVIAGTGEVADR